MKKFFVVFNIIIIIIYALLSNTSYADTNPYDAALNQEGIQTKEDIERFMNSGSAVGGDDTSQRVVGKDETGKDTTITAGKLTDRSAEATAEQGSAISTLIGQLIITLSSVIRYILSNAVNSAYTYDEGFTIQNLVFDKYELFDINVFDENVQYENTSDINKLMKGSVKQWYANIRLIAIMLSFPILLYIAIRMATSTIAADKARYKKMLTAWFTGFLLIFILQYLVLIFIYVSDFFVKLLAEVAKNSGTQFEVAVIKRIDAAKGIGWENLLRAVLYFMLTIYQLKYFLFYLKRLISNSFLILVSPLVTATYAIDKAQDCKAQAFETWKKELIANTFIQPVHALLILIFMFSAGKIAELYPIIAIAFLFGLSTTEKLLRTLFKLNGSSVGDVEKSINLKSLVG